MSDDQGYADVGYHNPDCPIPTPNIDKLARNGVRLENYYVHPTCTPTRASLLTGTNVIKLGGNIQYITLFWIKVIRKITLIQTQQLFIKVDML